MSDGAETLLYAGMVAGILLFGSMLLFPDYWGPDEDFLENETAVDVEISTAAPGDLRYCEATVDVETWGDADRILVESQQSWGSITTQLEDEPVQVRIGPGTRTLVYAVTFDGPTTVLEELSHDDLDGEECVRR